MRFLIIFILAVLVVFLVIQIVSFSKQVGVTEKRYEELLAQLERVRHEYETLKTDYEYYLNPDNLEKELRARFNFTAPGEKLIIVVPSRSSTPAAP